MAITIKELLASDTISGAADKINFNFDQLLLNGGGPVGPAGGFGPPGPIGGRGERGSFWFEDPSGAAGTPLDPGDDPNTLTIPDAQPNDSYLRANGEVWEYTGITWVDTGVNIKGATGSSGSSLDWSTFGDNGGPIVGGLDTIYPQEAPASVPNNINSLLIGGQPEVLGPLGSGYDINDGMAAEMNSNHAALYLHVPGPFNVPFPTIAAIKFSGTAGGGGAAGDYTLVESELANISLQTGDQVIIQDSTKTPAIATATLGMIIETHRKDMWLEVGRGFQLRTGKNNTVGVVETNSDISLEVLGAAQDQTGESVIFLDNNFKTGGPLSDSAELTIGGAGTTAMGSNNLQTRDITSVSRDAYFNVNNKLIIDSGTSTQPGAITIDSPSGGFQVSTFRDIVLGAESGGSGIGQSPANIQLFAELEALTYARKIFLNTHGTNNGYPYQGNIDVEASYKLELRVGAPGSPTQATQDLNIHHYPSSGHIDIESFQTYVQIAANTHIGIRASTGHVLIHSVAEEIYNQAAKGIGFNIGTNSTPGATIGVGSNSGMNANVNIGTNIVNVTNNIPSSLWVEDQISIGNRATPGTADLTRLQIEQYEERGLENAMYINTGIQTGQTGTVPTNFDAIKIINADTTARSSQATFDGIEIYAQVSAEKNVRGVHVDLTSLATEAGDVVDRGTVGFYCLDRTGASVRGDKAHFVGYTVNEPTDAADTAYGCYMQGEQENYFSGDMDVRKNYWVTKGNSTGKVHARGNNGNVYGGYGNGGAINTQQYGIPGRDMFSWGCYMDRSSAWDTDNPTSPVSFINWIRVGNVVHCTGRLTQPSPAVGFQMNAPCESYPNFFTTVFKGPHANIAQAYGMITGGNANIKCTTQEVGDGYFDGGMPLITSVPEIERTWRLTGTNAGVWDLVSVGGYGQQNWDSDTPPTDPTNNGKAMGVHRGATFAITMSYQIVTA